MTAGSGYCSASQATTIGTTVWTGSRACFVAGRPARKRGRRVVGVSPLMILQYAAWAREFLRGGAVDKPEALALAGYTPVQSASHFALRLAPRIDLLGVDRQLTAIDPGSASSWPAAHGAHRDSATLVVMPDPVHLFGEPSRTGTEMVANLRLDTNARETFVLTGDIHHYERAERGDALHVIAGGGGAFLHPARIAGGGLTPKVSWPGVAQSRRLLRDVPWKLAGGRSGLLPHIALLLIFAPALLFGGRLFARAGTTIAVSIVTTIVVGVTFALLGGAARREGGAAARARRRHRHRADSDRGVVALVRAVLPISGDRWTPSPCRA